MWASEIKQSALPASSFSKIAKDCVRQQRSLLFVLRVGKKKKNAIEKKRSLTSKNRLKILPIAKLT